MLLRKSGLSLDHTLTAVHRDIETVKFWRLSVECISAGFVWACFWTVHELLCGDSR